MNKPFRNSFRPHLEVLEGRYTPAGTVTGNLAHGVWTLTGDNGGNSIIVNSTGAAGSFTAFGNGPTVVNGDSDPIGVKAIVFDFTMPGGSDFIQMNKNATPIKLGSLTFKGGDGGNTFYATQLTVKKNLTITNGNGFNSIDLTGFEVKKSIVINNGDGGSQIRFFSRTDGFNSIGRHLKIFNGSGEDATTVYDTHVGGNIINENGAGDGTYAGSFEFRNNYQTADRAIIGGNVMVSFMDDLISSGDPNGLWDAKVKGNVTFNNGTANASTSFDGLATSLPLVIKGNLTFNGSGTNEVKLGAGGAGTGLTVGGNLLLNLSNPLSTVQANNLTVKGKTEII